MTTPNASSHSGKRRWSGRLSREVEMLRARPALDERQGDALRMSVYAGASAAGVLLALRQSAAGKGSPGT